MKYSGHHILDILWVHSFVVLSIRIALRMLVTWFGD